MPSNIPTPRVPMIDARSGLVNRDWYRFFLNLFDLADAGNNTWTLTDLMQAPPVVPSSGDTFPQGGIIFWVGSTPPSGWEEVVELRGRFPRGMPLAGTPGATGGTSTHVNSISSGGAHTHPIGVTNKYGVGSQFASDASGTGSGGGHDHGGSTGSADHTNPYVDGMWIRKL